MIRSCVFEYLLNSLWQLPLLVAAAWLLIRLARPALSVQHGLWLTTLLLAVVLPARGIAWPAPMAATMRVPYADTLPPTPSTATKVPSSLRRDVERLTGLHVQTVRLNDRTIDWILELYAVSIALSLARLVHGFLAARRLVESAVQKPLTTLESTLLAVCAQKVRLASERLPEVRFLGDLSMTPMVIGIRRPVLLLPESLRHTTDGNFNDLGLTAILSHELTHVRRRDYLTNLLTRIVSLPVAYHPASRILHQRVRQTREMICDASASGLFESTSSYARSLLAIADRLVPPAAHVEAPGLFDQARNTLEERIMILTTERLPIRLSLRAARTVAGAAILVAAAGSAATVHVKPAGRLAEAAPVVYAAQAPQAPQTPQAATPVPTPVPEPKPHVQPRIVIDSQAGADLTPGQRAQMERDLANAREQVEKATRQLNDPAFKKQLAESVDVANSAGFKQQMADLKKKLDSPEFRQQIAEAQKLARMPDIKVDLSGLKVQLDSAELRAQIESAKALAMQAGAEAGERSADAHRQLEEAAAAIAEARRQVKDAKVQEQLDRARKSVQDATKNIR